MAAALFDPLPPPESPERWSALQELRRTLVDPGPWLAGLEAGRLTPATDLLAVLAGKVNQLGARRLLALEAAPLLAALDQELLVWSQAATAAWLEPLLEAGDPALLPLLGRCRDPRVAERLRRSLSPASASASASAMASASLQVLLPLLGHQRQPGDLSLLLQWARQPGPVALRRAALEGVALGLAAWPAAELRQALAALAQDLDPALAAKAVDLLARLPQGAGELRALRGQSLDPAVRQRLERRLASRRRPLLLVVHGRSGGLIPAELEALAAELAERRGAPVQLLALSAAALEGSAASAALRAAVQARGALALVPLLLLPGGHVRRDLPAIAAQWRQLGPLRRYPFLGAWPRWQAALRRELAALGPGALLLHHPLEGPLAVRYLAQLERACGCLCRATPYSADQLAELQLTLSAPALPLALAANRLTDQLAEQVGPPLLQRPALRQLLLAELEALP
ncbi:MAG: CbiX/SirB N-terminal domain-containing protein [Prochlorococcaceae cyanobacterium]